MIVVSTYQKAVETDEGTSWTRRDEAEAYSEEAASLAARTLLDDAVVAGESLANLAVLFEDGDHRPESVEYTGGAFVPAEEYLGGWRW